MFGGNSYPFFRDFSIQLEKLLWLHLQKSPNSSKPLYKNILFDEIWKFVFNLIYISSIVKSWLTYFSLLQFVQQQYISSANKTVQENLKRYSNIVVIHEQAYMFYSNKLEKQTKSVFKQLFAVKACNQVAWLGRIVLLPL